MHVQLKLARDVRMSYANKMARTGEVRRTDSTSYMTLNPSDVLGVLNDVEKRNAPKELYVMGDITLLQRGPRISIVGSRKATHEGRARARALAYAMVMRNMVVVSGLAEGIDAAAHGGAIEAGGKTIA